MSRVESCPDRVAAKTGAKTSCIEAERSNGEPKVLENTFDYAFSCTPTVTANLVDEEVQLVFRPQGEDPTISNSGVTEDEFQIDQTGDERKDRSESFDVDERSKKNSMQQLTRLSTIDRSSNSSLNSCDLVLDEGSNGYPSYGGSRETLDSFSLHSGDLIEDGSSGRERESSVIHLEQEIEKLTDSFRATEASKDRHIQSLECEIQNLKLEIANFTARENVSVLKSRLELESKSLKVHDLECELRHLQDTIEKMTVNKHFEESDQYNLQRELTRSKNKVITLEEEKKTLEERLLLAEDLQNNDRELLEVLRHQLTALEKDLSFCQERTKTLEERNKTLEKSEHDLIEERSRYAKLLKQSDALASKLHQREIQMNDLEDDVVRLQQLNMDYRKEINRDLEIIEKLEGKLHLRQREVDECNREVMVLAAEKKKLSELQPVEKRSEITFESNSVQMKELESRVVESDQQIQDLQLENDQLIREIGDLLENLSNVNNELEDCKEHVHKAEKELESFRRTRRDNERKIHSLQKKLNRVDREKKKYLQEKLQAQEEILLLQRKLNNFNDQYDHDDKSQKMLLLKLQSTEAKLAMLEGNKIYMESKLNSYRAKIKEQTLLINKVGIPLEVAAEDNFRDLKEQNVLYKNQIEVTELLTSENDKIISELRNQNKEYSISVVAMQREIINLKNELSRVQSLNEQLEKQLVDCGKTLVSAQERLGETLEYLNHPIEQSNEVIKSISFSLKDICSSLISQLNTIAILSTETANRKVDCVGNSVTSNQGGFPSTDLMHGDSLVPISAQDSDELTFQPKRPDSLKDQLKQLKEHIHNVGNITNVASAYYDEHLSDETRHLGSQDAEKSLQRSSYGTGSSADVDLPKENKGITKVKLMRLRSASAPELCHAKLEDVSDEGSRTQLGGNAHAPLVSDKVDAITKSNAVHQRSSVNVTQVLESKMRSPYIVSHKPDNDKKPYGKFVIQAKGPSVRLQEDQQGSVVIKIAHAE